MSYLFVQLINRICLATSHVNVYIYIQHPELAASNLLNRQDLQRQKQETGRTAKQQDKSFAKAHLIPAKLILDINQSV